MNVYLQEEGEETIAPEVPVEDGESTDATTGMGEETAAPAAEEAPVTEEQAM